MLVTGQWPAAPGPAAEQGPAAARTPIPAALPAAAAALLHVTVGDVLRFRDRDSNAPVAFKVTGLFAERALSGTAASYWQLNSVPASGSSTLERVHHLRAAGGRPGGVPRRAAGERRDLGRPAGHG